MKIRCTEISSFPFRRCARVRRKEEKEREQLLTEIKYKMKK